MGLGRNWLVGGAVLALGVFAAPAAAIDEDSDKVPGSVIKELEKATKAPLSQFRLDAEREAETLSVYRFEQVLKVEDSEGDIPNKVEVADSDLVIVRVDTETEDPERLHAEDLRLDDKAKLDLRGDGELIEKDEAIEAAEEAVGEEAVAVEDKVRLEAKTEKKAEDGSVDGRLLYIVPVTATDPTREVEVAVNALTGEVTKEEEETVQATGAAAVYDPNPVVNNGGADGLPLSGNEDTDQLTALRVEVPLPNLDGSGCLRGAWVYVTNGPKTAAEEICAPGGDFRGITRSDPAFEGVMTYFHIDRLQRYYQSLGFNGQSFPTVLAGPMRVYVNAMNEPNSFFEIASRALLFGRGPIDEAEDGDGIAHEYGHATQYAQVPGWGKQNEGRALGEGFGDYIAAVNSELAGADPFFQVCMYEWVDFAQFTSTGCSRRADTTLTLPQVKGPPCNLQFHCAGQAWSSALWALRQQIGVGPDGVNIMDRVVLASHFLLTPQAKFFDAARAVIKMQDQLYNDPAVRELMFAEFRARGFIQ